MNVMLKKLLTNIWTLISILVIGLLIVSLRGCSLYDQNSILKGRYDELKKVAVADHAILTNEIGQLTNDNVLKDKEIAKLKEEKIVINTALTSKDKDLIALRASWAKFSVECQDALSVLDAKWIEKELLYKQEISAECGVTALWIGKYNNAIKIGDDWKKDYENERALRLLCEKRVSKLEGGLRWAKFWRTGATALAVVAGGYVGYTLIKGK